MDGWPYVGEYVLFSRAFTSELGIGRVLYRPLNEDEQTNRVPIEYCYGPSDFCEPLPELFVESQSLLAGRSRALVLSNCCDLVPLRAIVALADVGVPSREPAQWTLVGRHETHTNKCSALTTHDEARFRSDMQRTRSLRARIRAAMFPEPARDVPAFAMAPRLPRAAVLSHVSPRVHSAMPATELPSTAPPLSTAAAFAWGPGLLDEPRTCAPSSSTRGARLLHAATAAALASSSMAPVATATLARRAKADGDSRASNSWRVPRVESADDAYGTLPAWATASAAMAGLAPQPLNAHGQPRRHSAIAAHALPAKRARVPDESLDVRALKRPPVPLASPARVTR